MKNEQELNAEITAIEAEKEDLWNRRAEHDHKYDAMSEDEWPYEDFLNAYSDMSEKQAELRSELKKLTGKRPKISSEISSIANKYRNSKEYKETVAVNKKKFPQIGTVRSYDAEAEELQEILVQTVIDYMLTHGITEIDAVSFGVDGLQGSIPFGEWTPSSDSSITLRANVFDPETELVCYENVGKCM